MRPLRANFGKICQRTKRFKAAEVYGWGKQIFSKIAQRKQKSLKTCQLRVYSRKLMHSYTAIMAYIGVLSMFTQVFSLAM